MSLNAEARDLVTDHVIIRWLERVEGYDFTDIREEIKAKGQQPIDSQILRYLASRYGLYKGHVMYKIVTKQVRQAIELGAKRVNRGDQTLILNNGVVVTMIPRINKVATAERHKRKKGSTAPKNEFTHTFYSKGRKVMRKKLDRFK